MQKFLGVLKEKRELIYAKEYGDISISTNVFFRTMRAKFKMLEGRRVQYIDKQNKCNCIAIVKEALPYYVLLERTFYGSGEPYTINTCISYGSLYCRDAILKEEK